MIMKQLKNMIHQINQFNGNASFVSDNVTVVNFMQQQQQLWELRDKSESFFCV